MKPDVAGRGVLHEKAARGVYDARRVLPSKELERHVDYFWLVRWRLEASFDQHVLTLPAAHFVFEQDDATGRRASRFAGPGRRRFTRTLAGAGHVFGIALRAGTAFAWARRPLAHFADQHVPLRSVWRHDVAATERSVLGARSDEAQVRAAERFVRKWLPPLDADAETAARLVERICADRGLCRVEQLMELSGLSERSLQRLFHRHVGINPKAVVRRFRLVEAAQALEQRAVPSLTELAHALGYYDQAHFIRDFKATVGRAPSAHRREAAMPPPLAT